MKNTKKFAVAALLAALCLVLFAAAALADNGWCSTCSQKMTLKSYIREPFCEMTGKGYFTCPNGHTEIQYTKALGHKWTRLKAEFPTCTKDGWQQVECTRCGANERQKLKMKSHWYETPWVCNGNGTHSSDCRYGCGDVGTQRCTMWLYETSEEGACKGVCLVCGDTQSFASLDEAKRAYPQYHVMSLQDTYDALVDKQKGFMKTRSCEAYLKIGEHETLRDRYNIYVGSGASEGVLACVVNTLPEGVKIAADGEAMTKIEAKVEGGRGSQIYGEGVAVTAHVANGTQAVLVASEYNGVPEKLPAGVYVTLPIASEGGEDTLVLNLDLSKANKSSKITSILVVFPESSEGWNAPKN